MLRRIACYCCLTLMVLSTQGAAASTLLSGTAQDSELEPQTTSLVAFQKDTAKVQFAFNLEYGVRFDQLKWNIAGNISGTNPDILSELEWSDILSHQISTSGRIWIGRYFYGRGILNYAQIQNGTVRDSDYDGNGGTQEWSQSISETNGDQLWDIIVGGGYPFTFRQKRVFVAPMLGLSVHRQNLRITNGQQVISTRSPAPAVGPLDSRLNSMYRAQWESLWVGCDLRYQLESKNEKAPPMEWGVSLAYHFLGDYSAEADWNLRPDLGHPCSFKHEADPQGFLAQIEWLIRMTDRINMRMSWNYTHWTTNAGVVTAYPVDGPTVSTRLNGVDWESHSLLVGATYHF